MASEHYLDITTISTICCVTSGDYPT